MLSGDIASRGARSARLRTKFIAAFVVLALLITLLTVGMSSGESKLATARHSPITYWWASLR